MSKERRFAEKISFYRRRQIEADTNFRYAMSEMANLKVGSVLFFSKIEHKKKILLQKQNGLINIETRTWIY